MRLGHPVVMTRRKEWRQKRKWKEIGGEKYRWEYTR